MSGFTNTPHSEGKMHTNGDHSQPSPAPPPPPPPKWTLFRRTGCRCSPLEIARRQYRPGCPVHYPPTHTVTAGDIGLTDAELAILQQLNAGYPVLSGRPQAVDRMRDRGYIEATGELPKDGWKLTEEGLAMVIAAGTFRIDPRMKPALAVTVPVLAALLAGSAIAGVLIYAWVLK